MPSLKEDLGYTTTDLALIITGYSLIYAIGQFANGFLSDRFGPRLIVGFGLIIAIASNVLMGIAASTLTLLGILYIANGYAQPPEGGVTEFLTTARRHRMRYRFRPERQERSDRRQRKIVRVPDSLLSRRPETIGR